MFVILVHKKDGKLEVVQKGSKKYKKMKYFCKVYKENLNKKPLENEVLETNKLLMT